MSLVARWIVQRKYSNTCREEHHAWLTCEYRRKSTTLGTTHSQHRRIVIAATTKKLKYPAYCVAADSTVLVAYIGNTCSMQWVQG